MSNIFDARGRSCPEPVIIVKNALKSDTNGIIVLVDSQVAVENVKRFAEGKGFKVEVIDKADDFEINIKR